MSVAGSVEKFSDSFSMLRHQRVTVARKKLLAHLMVVCVSNENKGQLCRKNMKKK